MRYRVRRIAPGSALRAGCALGWLAALAPALCVAGLIVRLIARANAALGGLRQAEIILPDLQIPLVGTFPLGSVRLDLAGPLGLGDAARAVGELAAQAPAVFGVAALALVIAGGLAVAVAAGLLTLGYNLLAARGAALEIELEAAERADEMRNP